MGRQERSGRGVNSFQRRFRKQDFRYGRGGVRKILQGTQSHQVGISRPPPVRYNDYYYFYPLNVAVSRSQIRGYGSTSFTTAFKT